MTLTLPTVPPSLNKIVRMHWKRRVSLQWRWDRRIRAAYKKLPEQERREFKTKVIIKIEYFFKSDQDHDRDRFAPLLIMDALKHNGIIVDDNDEFCEYDWTITIRAPETYTLITIEEWE